MIFLEANRNKSGSNKGGFTIAKMSFCLFPADQSEQKSTKEEILRGKKKSFLGDIWSRRCSEE